TCDANGLFPVTLLFIYKGEMPKRILAMRPVARQFLEQAFRPVEQTGLEVILAQRKQRLRPVGATQVWPGNQVLVNANCTIDFTAPPEQAAKREMGFDGIAVDFDHLDEHIQGIVRL